MTHSAFHPPLRPWRRMVSAGLGLAAVLALTGCLQTVNRPVVPAPSAPPQTVLPPLADPGLAANSVAVRLTDGSPGLALWCELRSECIDAARVLCSDRQSIRTSSDIDRLSPGAAEFFSRSEGAAHTLTVSCPV